MAYADIAFGISVYGEDAIYVAFDRDRDGTLSVAETLGAELLFEVATAEIESYLMGRVPLPFENVPLDIKVRCLDIAIYRACPDAASLTEEKTARFKAAHEWLKLVAKNEIKLVYGGAAAGGTHKTQRAHIVPAEEGYAEQETGARWFSRQNRQ